MCQVFSVCRSAYYKWISKKPSKRAMYNERLLKEIKAVYENSKCTYGSPRITKELEMNQIKVSKPLVAKLMKQHQLRSIIRKKYRITTDSSHKYPVVENKLNRAFTTQQPNEVWISDITYIPTKQGWLYLTTIIDLFDRKVIGWSHSESLKAKDTILPAFQMAQVHRPILDKEKQLIFHSDRGIQYACDEFITQLNKHKNIIRSMSRKANCWDNAVAESFFKTLKTELIYHHKYQTKQQAALSIFEYIETWYNKNRRHQKLGNLTIVEFEKLFFNHFKTTA